jgi:hypothetical protein
MVKSYTNRTDLQNKTTKVAKMAAKGQTYGSAGQQMQAQSVVPMGKPPTDTGAAGQPQKNYAMPGTIGSFDRPTERPNEPVTSGAPFGPGSTPFMAGTLPRMSTESNTVEQIRAIYAAFPNDDLAALLESYSVDGY